MRGLGQDFPPIIEHLGDVVVHFLQVKQPAFVVRAEHALLVCEGLYPHCWPPSDRIKPNFVLLVASVFFAALRLLMVLHSRPYNECFEAEVFEAGGPTVIDVIVPRWELWRLLRAIDGSPKIIDAAQIKRDGTAVLADELPACVTINPSPRS